MCPFMRTASPCLRYELTLSAITLLNYSKIKVLVLKSEGKSEHVDIPSAMTVLGSAVPPAIRAAFVDVCM